MSKNQKHFLLVDGYNILFAWDEVGEFGELELAEARDSLVHRLSNYAGFRELEILLVFDAHKSKEPPSTTREGGIWLIYTAYSETADEFIERTTKRLTRNDKVTVATSDGLEQVIIMGYGGNRMSARDLLREIKRAESSVRDKMKENKPIKNNMLFDHLDPVSAKFLDDLRRQ